jgi:hypothetical protein
MSPVRQPTEYRRSVCLHSALSERVHIARCWMTDILSGESLSWRRATECPPSDSRQNVGAPYLKAKLLGPSFLVKHDAAVLDACQNHIAVGEFTI